MERIKKKLRQFQKRIEGREGIIGLEDGTLSGREGYVYVRLAGGTVAEVLNRRAGLAPGQRVLVGYDPLEPLTLQVLDEKPVGDETPAGADHAAKHGWFGGDPVYLSKRQVLNLGVYPNGLSVVVMQGVIWTGGAWRSVAESTLDLSGSVPGTSGQALYVLIYINTSGAAAARVGTTAAIGSLALADIPALGAGEAPLAAVRLYYGMTAIEENLIYTDLVDLRGGQAATTADLHAAVTVSDTSTVDLTLTGQALQAAVIPGGISHNDLGSKQGGTTGQYNHLTDAQLAALHAALTVTDTATVDLTLTGQALQATVLPGGIKLDDLGTPDDNTDLDASASRHGLLPKLSGGSGYYLNGAGAFDNTLKTRVDRLFGTDKPSHANFFTQRQFYINDYTNNIVGFETEANPYTFPTENCPFSWNAIPTGCTRNSWGSWLQMRVATSFPLTLRWSSSTKKNFLNAIMCFSPSIKTSDYLAYEIRWWGVQTPTASDKYWSFRIMWKPSTSSQWPLYGKLYSGTGITYAEGDGTARSGPIPIPMGTALSCQFGAWYTTSIPYGGFTIKSAEAIYGGNMGTVVSTWPNEAKCFDISITSGDYQTLHIDDIVLFNA